MTRYLFSILAFVAFAFPFPAVAQETNQPPKLVESYKDWRVYHYGSGESEICYILSEPTSKRPRGVNRGPVFFTITHRGDGTRNEVSMRAGYSFSSKSKPFARIGNTNFSFYTGVKEGDERAHWAWMRTTQEEDELIAAMKQGNEMVIKGTSSRGTITTDRYSLLGVSAALESIDKTCN